jgi:hypothetical protein
MIAGVILAELIIALKFVDKIAFIAKPITNFAHLSDECGTSFIAAFISPTSANSMRASFYNDGLIEKKELFIAAMINSFPSIVMHWRSMLPVLIPLLGVTGILYFSILMLVGLTKTSLLMVAGRFLLPGRNSNLISRNNPVRPPVKYAIKLSLQNSKRTVKRILIVTVPTTFIVFTLYAMSIFDILASHLSIASVYFPVQPEGVGIIAAQFGSYIAAVTVAGNLLSAGVLTAKNVIVALLVGNVLSSFLTVIRFSTPYYVGIFGPKNGMQIMLLSATIRTGIILGVIFVLALIW